MSVSPAIITSWFAAVSPSAMPGGDADGDANDWSGTPLVLFGILAVAVVVAAVVIARYRSHRGKTPGHRS
jgi:hypothetical protein